ncbi:MAG: translation initiation factor IF-2 [Holosporaceae bacterium]|jgi:translation initiation factor IF-2|nr:translation initiation factor IF-2 [Holosporaceae bacterium]
MTDQKKGTLSLSLPTDIKKTTELSGNRVRQSFSHGKTKVVAVEVKKKRVSGKPPSVEESKLSLAELQKSGDLTNRELETRVKAVRDAIKESKEQEELRIIREQEEKERERLRAEEEARNPKPPEVDEAGSDQNQSEIAEKKSDSETEKSKNERVEKISPRKHSRDYDYEDDSSSGKNSAKKTSAVKRNIEELRRRYAPGAGRISIHNALDGDDGKIRSLSSIKRARQKHKAIKTDMTGEVKIIKEVILPETISIQELSNRMAVRTGDVVKTLMKLGVMATAAQIIDADTAELIIMEFGHKVKRVSDSDIEIGLKKKDDPADLQPRPPVVTVMGHVDHGKTSLLDALRKTDVALTEAGGITQCIGAYQVTTSDGRKITFIDTPGHAAFTEMRSRGANVTDIVVLVVAADDGVKDQTIEAINHAQAAGVPLVVAINKTDKPGSAPENVRKDLLNQNVVTESFGGDVMDVEISAKAGKNLNKLEEVILLQAEILELKANPNREAEGIVIESKVEKGLGPVATVLINKGTLRCGDIFVSGTAFGRVRAIRNHLGESLKEITPGTPGEIIGFSCPTIPGDDFIVVENESKAREITGYRDRKKREQTWVISAPTTVEQMFSKLKADEKLRVLSVIVKADVQGSSEAVCTSLKKLATDEVAVRIIHAGIGEITESDVALARASNALILGFNVRANMQARDQISLDKIQVKYYSVIYDLIDDVKALLSGMLTPEILEHFLGTAEVKKLFDVSKFGKIAGCMIVNGLVKRGAKARLLRNGAVVHVGSIKSLRRNKDDVKEVKAGFECGISLENYEDIHPGDMIECFELEEIARQLS